MLALKGGTNCLTCKVHSHTILILLYCCIRIQEPYEGISRTLRKIQGAFFTRVKCGKESLSTVSLNPAFSITVLRTIRVAALSIPGGCRVELGVPGIVGALQFDGAFLYLYRLKNATAGYGNRIFLHNAGSYLFRLRSARQQHA